MCCVEERVFTCNAFAKSVMCRGKSVAECFVNNTPCQQCCIKEQDTEKCRITDALLYRNTNNFIVRVNSYEFLRLPDDGLVSRPKHVVVSTVNIRYSKCCVTRTL